MFFCLKPLWVIRSLSLDHLVREIIEYNQRSP
jgi:hypothetical protein